MKQTVQQSYRGIVAIGVCFVIVLFLSAWKTRHDETKRKFQVVGNQIANSGTDANATMISALKKQSRSNFTMDPPRYRPRNYTEQVASGSVKAQETRAERMAKGRKLLSQLNRELGLDTTDAEILAILGGPDSLLELKTREDFHREFWKQMMYRTIARQAKQK